MGKPVGVLFLVEGSTKKIGKDSHRTAQPSTLASIKTWGIRQELVV